LDRTKSSPIWTGPECLTCLSTIAYEVLQRAVDDPEIQMEGLKKTYELLTDFNLTSLPTAIANKIYRMIIILTKNPDPFKEIKRQSGQLAKEAIERIRPHIEEKKQLHERFYRSIAASIAGNMIDFGTAGHSIKMTARFLEKIYFQIVEQGFAVNDSNQLFESLARTNSLLYIADNAGEVYFDTFLMDLMKKQGIKIILVVKGGPISNDATLDDVNDPLFMKIANKIITTGTNALGVSILESSQEFREYLHTVDLIIAKGQSNFETLYYYHRTITDRPIYFIFRTKCACIAQFIGQKIGENIVFLKS